MSDENYEIYVNINDPYQADADSLLLAAWHALNIAATQPPVALTVVIASDDYVHQLNRDYAGIDSTTDVLSFPSEGDPYDTEPGAAPYLGDVVIAFPVAEQQARTAGHTITAELQTLAIHGTLHLLGYDHDSPENQATMWALQSAAMDAVRAAGG